MSSYISNISAFQKGLSSPVEVLEGYIKAIINKESAIQAFVHYDLESAKEQALQSATRWRNGTQYSMLDGIPLGVKDIIETRDFPTGQGIPRLSKQGLQRDAASVSALRAAGAIIVGKTTCTEFASTELLYPTANAHDYKRTPGGSSSGSAAAVGAGMLPLALASQCVGSTIRPASYNGTWGYKPTLGGLNRGGSFDYISQSCVGLIASDPDDIWVAARTISREVGGDPGHVGITGPDAPAAPQRPTRVGILHTDGWPRATETVKNTFISFIDGLRKKNIVIVDQTQDPSLAALESLLSGALAKTWTILTREMMWPLNTYRVPLGIGISDAMQQRLEQGRSIKASDYGIALAERTLARQWFSNVMSSFDCLLTLGAVSAAPEDLPHTGDPSFNVPASYLGCPALNIPALSDAGLPLGCQILGAHDEDARMFAYGKWIWQHHTS